MAHSAFPPTAVADFAEAYPLAPQHLTHNIAGHPLLEISALLALAERMRPETLEHNAAVDLPLGISNAEVPANGLSVAETIARIGECGSWVLLKNIEQDPAYAALMREVLSQVEPIVRPATGPMIRLEGFIFVSSPRR